MSEIPSSINYWGFSACTSGVGQPFNGITSGPFSGGTFTGGTTSLNNPTDIRYFRTLTLYIPTATGSTQCGQNTVEAGGQGFIGNGANGLFQYYTFHTSSTVITGITGSNTFMRIITTRMQQPNFQECQIDCNLNATSIVNSANLFTTGTSYTGGLVTSFTNTAASMTPTPFRIAQWQVFSCNPLSASTTSQSAKFFDYNEYTVPQDTSGNLVGIYSGSVCNYPRYGTGLFINGNQQSNLTLNKCTTIFTNSPSSFDIFCSSIVNWSATTSSLAYRLINGVETFCNSTFVVGC